MHPSANILIAESRSFAPEARRILSSVGSVTLADLDRRGLEYGVRTANVLWVGLRHRITKDLMESAPQLRVIASPTTGLNHIDLDAAARRGIQVISLRGETEFLRNVPATAEHTIALTLALLRHVPQAVLDVRRGGWDRDQFRGSELYGKSVGVVGYGRLGRIVADYFYMFGSHVLICDRAIAPDSVPPSVEEVTLEDLLRRADLVTLHVNFTSANIRFFGASQLARMKRGSYLINTSRGELIDEKELLRSLESGQIAGAALDVISDEHEPNLSPLIEYARYNDNLLITPHIGGCTRESMEKTEVFLANRVSDWLRRHEPAARSHGCQI